MAEEIDLQEIIALAEAKIQLGRTLVKDLDPIAHVDGVKKVQRKINNEISCLSNKVTDQTIQVNNIVCSNLHHFESLCKILLECQGLLYVDYALPMETRNSPLRIDAVCDYGATWIKVIARNSRSIEDAVHGRTSYGTKSIVDTAEEYVEASQLNLHMFKPPQVFFIFSTAMNEELVEMLQETGVQVGTVGEFQSGASQVDFEKQLEGVDTLNLDITTLLAYVSALTNPVAEHEGCFWQFPEPLLTEQSKWELRSPVKPVLDAIFAKRRLICCETARNSFLDIISLLGGDNEKTRTEELLSRVEILEDVDVDGELAELKVGGRIKPRSLKIFAFGLNHKAVTVTSNEGFIRAARMQGIDVPVFVHEARALTEEKEKKGKRVRL